ncbi:hypothetical protein EIP86_011309 [Pleurotus ostreatoroseus]|nr:hypothetical protein EIP86_011309 [Pleurotus ostreatoroseus]
MNVYADFKIRTNLSLSEDVMAMLPCSRPPCNPRKRSCPPNYTKIPETTLEEQIDMVDNSRTRKQKQSPGPKDDDEPAEEDEVD